MKIFACNNCNQQVYFENTVCFECGNALGFNRWTMEMLSFKQPPIQAAKVPKLAFRYCANYANQVCNWVVPQEQTDDYCLACSLNNTIPDLHIGNNTHYWQKLEIAKHRLVYSLLQLGLFGNTNVQYFKPELKFNFLADRSARKKIYTGHNRGLITINIKEADDAIREKMRLEMQEPYRTLLGHFRHETGHYYWDVLVKHSDRLEQYRQCFGNETMVYADALKKHYNEGPPARWQELFISSYAASHPWEDWAESWAHYLHMMDTLETGYYFGMGVQSQVDNTVSALLHQNPYTIANFNDIVSSWLPFTYALNSINRSMGLNDLYPFVLTQPIVNKLSFIHNLLHRGNS